MWWFVAWLGLYLAREFFSYKYIPAQYRLIYQLCEKPWDYYAAVVLYFLLPLTALAQHIIAPEESGVTVRCLGAVFYLSGNGLWIAARRVNPFFTPDVRKPAFVVEVGPYQYCNHPAYLGMSMSLAGVVLLLSSTWAMVPMLLYWGLLFRRAILEDRLLQRE